MKILFNTSYTGKVIKRNAKSCKVIFEDDKGTHLVTYDKTDSTELPAVGTAVIALVTVVTDAVEEPSSANKGMSKQTNPNKARYKQRGPPH